MKITRRQIRELVREARYGSVYEDAHTGSEQEKSEFTRAVDAFKRGTESGSSRDSQEPGSGIPADSPVASNNPADLYSSYLDSLVENSEYINEKDNSKDEAHCNEEDDSKDEAHCNEASVISVNESKIRTLEILKSLI